MLLSASSLWANCCYRNTLCNRTACPCLLSHVSPPPPMCHESTHRQASAFVLPTTWWDLPPKSSWLLHLFQIFMLMCPAQCQLPWTAPLRAPQPHCPPNPDALSCTSLFIFPRGAYHLIYMTHLLPDPHPWVYKLLGRQGLWTFSFYLLPVFFSARSSVPGTWAHMCERGISKMSTEWMNLERL